MAAAQSPEPIGVVFWGMGQLHLTRARQMTVEIASDQSNARPATATGVDSASGRPRRIQIGRSLFWGEVFFIVLGYFSAGPFLFRSPGTESTWALYLATIVVISSLLGACAGLGNHSRRWPFVIVISPVIGWYSSYSIGDGGLIQFEVFVLANVVVVAVLTWVTKVRLGQFLRLTSPSQIASGLQFRISDLLIWTTAFSILAAVGNAIWHAGDRFQIDSELIAIFLMSGSLAIGTATNFWALLGDRVSPLRLLLVAMVTFASVAASFLLFAEWIFLLMASVSQIAVVMLICALRLQGYRFVKSRT